MNGPRPTYVVVDEVTRLEQLPSPEGIGSLWDWLRLKTAARAGFSRSERAGPAEPLARP